MKKVTFLVVVLFCLTGSNKFLLLAKDAKFSIESILGFGINYYNGHFNGIPNNSCCTSFESGIGSGFSLGLNLQLNQKSRILDYNLTPFFQISYLNYSGLFTKEEYFANFIYGNEVFPAISRHSFDANIQTLELLIGSVFSDISKLGGIGIRFGLGLSFPLASTYNQQEELVSPEMAFFENGTKIRNVIHSKIPIINFQINLVTSLQYLTLKYKNWELLPVFTFRFPFMNVAKNVNWKIYRFEFAMAGKYIIPEPEPIAPVNPPLPELPNPLPPPKASPAVFDIHIKINNVIMHGGDTIEIKRKLMTYYSKEFILPMLFFERNDFNLTLENIKLNSKIKQQQESNLKVLLGVVNYLKTHPQSKLKILSYRLDDELPNMSNLRIIRVIEFLRQSGINQEDIATEEKEFKANNFPHTELADEYRKVQLLLDEEMKILSVENIVRIDTIAEPVKVEISSEVIEPKNSPVSIKGKVILPNKEINFVDEILLETIEIKSFDSSSNSIKIQATAESKDINSSRKNLEKEIYLVFRDYIETIEKPFKGKNNTKYYLIGLCDFDKDNFYWTNPDIKKIVDSLLQDGKKLRIFGSVDDFGEKKYNQQLAKRRATNARKLLKSDIEISTNDDLILDLPKILQRMFQRSAWVVVED